MQVSIIGAPIAACIEELATVRGDFSTFYAVGANYVPGKTSGGKCSGEGVIYRVTQDGGQWTLEGDLPGVEFISVAAIVTSRRNATKATRVLAGTLDNSATGYNLYYFNVVDGQSAMPTMMTGVPHEGAPIGGGTWWKYLSTNATAHNNLMDNPGYAASNIQIAPDGHTAYIAGRANIMVSLDLGVNWYPAVHKMNVTFNRGIAVDANGVYVADTDWQFLYSNDQMQSVTQNAPSANGSGDSVAILTAGSHTTVFAGIQKTKAGKKSADVFTTEDVTSGTWTDENLAANAILQPTMGVAAKMVNGEVTILAAVETSGLWRGVKSSVTSPATWTQVLSAFNHDDGSASTDTAPIVWDQSRTAAYVYDRDYGIYRSQDEGVTWTLVYPSTTTSNPGMEKGYLALDEATDTLYITNNAGLFYVANASTASGPFVPTPVPNPQDHAFGPVAFANGVLYVTGPFTDVAPLPSGNIYIYSPSAGTLTSIADQFAKGNAGLPDAIAVDQAGNVYLGMDGQGVIVGYPINCGRHPVDCGRHDAYFSKQPGEHRHSQ